MKSSDDGFTLTEFIIVVILLGILVSLALPGFVKSKDKAREAEVKSNVHSIQIALARYAVDNNDRLPAMIWGGDKKGWSTEKGVGCRTMWEHEPYNGENEDDAHPPFDPLLFYGYLDSYPRNPFINRGMGVKSTIKWTSPQNPKPGDGDPRFGYDGELMCNIITDPFYLWKKEESGRIRPTRIKNCFNSSRFQLPAMISNIVPGNPFYALGGIPEWSRFISDYPDQHTPVSERKSITTHWPGEFFYRSINHFFDPPEYSETKEPEKYCRTIWDFKRKNRNAYMLGGFGSMWTDGSDIIRLTDVYGNTVDNLIGYMGGGIYEPHSDSPLTEKYSVCFSSPELFGGGEEGQMPYFPYFDPKDGYLFYGAPDGYKDGVIITVTGIGCR